MRKLLVTSLLLLMLITLPGCDDTLTISMSEVKSTVQSVVASSDYELIKSAYNSQRYTTIYYNDICYVRFFILSTGAAPVFKFQYHNNGWSLIDYKWYNILES